MKLTVDHDALSGALSVVSRAVAGKTALTILEYILLDADGDRLTLTGTDLTTGLRTAVNATVQTAGRIALDPRILAEWLSNAPAETVAIEVDIAKWRATFRAGGGRITLAGLDPEDYPVFPDIAADAPRATVFAPVLRAMIGRTVIATDPGESRPVLHGMKMTLAPDHIQFAAADGFRMAVDRIDVETGLDDEATAIVPRESATALAGILPDDGGEVVLSLTGPNHTILAARTGETTWTSRLIEGTFPDVQQLIRREHTATVGIGRTALRSALRGSRSLSMASNDVVFLSLDSDGEVRVSAESAERGDSDVLIPMELTANGGHPDKIALNWKYLVEVLGVLDRDTVAVHLGTSDTTPIQVTDPALPGYVNMIMPVVVKERTI